MFISFGRRRWWWWVAYSVLGLVFYNEWMSYIIASRSWPDLSRVTACSTSYRILLVADPQILGENTESAVARWDADRYLSKTFNLAVWKYKPSLIIFLGDLMDEGSSSTNAQFERYFNRFYRIFSLDLYKNKVSECVVQSIILYFLFLPIKDNCIFVLLKDVDSFKCLGMRYVIPTKWPRPSLSTMGLSRIDDFVLAGCFYVTSARKTLYIPGDNDIGGEDEDVITKEKVQRFRNHFNQPETFQTSNFVIFKVNHMLRSYSPLNVSDKKTMRIAISHYPMLDMPSRFMQRALVETGAQLILSAHEHKSMHFVGSRKTGERLIVEELEVNEFSSSLRSTWLFHLDSSVSNEISVPTCSYRMGTEKMAYGLLNIDSRGETFCYSLLWLPKRLNYLKIYLGYLCTLTFLWVFCLLAYRCTSRSRRLLPL